MSLAFNKTQTNVVNSVNWYGHGGPSASRMTLSVSLSMDTGVALPADPGLPKPFADWALENRRGC